MRGSIVGGDADAGVPHPHDHLAALPLGRQPDPAARLGVLGGVVQQVAEDLLQPGRVGVQPDRLAAAASTVSSWPPSSISGRARLDRAAARPPPARTALPAELDLAPADPGHVQQVVDQPGQLPDLPLHHRPGLARRSSGSRGQSEDLQGVADRGQRVAQLVGQRRQELVLAAVGLPQRLLGPLALGDVAVAAS